MKNTLEDYYFDIETIKNHCMQIRQAILKVKDDTSLFKYFPKGCCRDTSVITGMFLKEKGFIDIDYCHKEFDVISSHAWLEYKGFVIDLTLDQFGDEFPGVLIVPVRESTIYHQLTGKETCNLGIVGFDGFKLLADYKAIKSAIIIP